MIQRALHILLAVAIAAVFTGRMEAAASHCVQVATETAALAGNADDREPCHDATAAGGSPGSQEAPAPSGQMGHDACACIAMLKASPLAAGVQAASDVSPARFAAAAAPPLASADPSPEWKPPRA